MSNTPNPVRMDGKRVLKMYYFAFARSVCVELIVALALGVHLTSGWLGIRSNGLKRAAKDPMAKTKEEAGPLLAAVNFGRSNEDRTRTKEPTG